MLPVATWGGAALAPGYAAVAPSGRRKPAAGGRNLGRRNANTFREIRNIGGLATDRQQAYIRSFAGGCRPQDENTSN